MKSLSKNKGVFASFAGKVAHYAGSPGVFIGAVLIVLTWAVSGPIFGYSDTWQLVINTGTTIVTFLMVFLIQQTQNRDTQAMQLKLDELIRVTQGAHTVLLDLEELSEDELQAMRDAYEKIAQKARKNLAKGLSDTNVPRMSLK